VLVRLAAGGALLPDEAAATAARDRPLVLLKLMFFTGAGIAWLLWVHRTYGNLALVGSKRSRFTRRWAMSYWFIPLINLVRAYQVMKDLWLRSDSLNDRDAAGVLAIKVVREIDRRQQCFEVSPWRRDWARSWCGYNAAFFKNWM